MKSQRSRRVDPSPRRPTPYSVNWSYSVDGGKTSLTAGKTGVAHTTIPDLTLGILPLFSNPRVLASTVEGWSDPISRMVP